MARAPRVSKLVGQLMLRVGGVARHDNTPGPDNAEVGDDGLRRIGEAQRDAVSFADAQGGETAGETLDEGMAVAVGEGLAEEVQGRPARKALRTSGEHRYQRFGRQRQLVGNSLRIV
jgi:hypothetical protein